MLELKNISWSVRDRGGILKDISFKVPRGRLAVVTGPNGGGKTSLAKVIAGLIPEATGQIFLDGEDISACNITERAKRGVSFGFQQPVRFKGITVRMLLNIAAGRNLSFDEACTYLGKVGLCAVDYVNRDVDQSLSGGEAKRIEIATVLARGTRLSIFDEPEAGIDMWSFNGLVDVFESLKHGDDTLLIISHQERIINIADDIIVIADGKIRDMGTKWEMLPRLMEGDMVGRCPLGKKVNEK